MKKTCPVCGQKYMTACGQTYTGNENCCGVCGAELRRGPEERSCPFCDARLKPWDRYCPVCREPITYAPAMKVGEW